MAKKVTKRNMLHDEMRKRFGSLATFWRDTEVGRYLSFESCRRILLLGREPSPYHLMVVMSALGLSTRDITEQLRARGDRYIWPLLAADDEKDTTLHRLARAMKRLGPRTKESVEVLIGSIIDEEGVTLDDQNQEGFTPIMVAARLGNDEVATLMLELGARCDIEDRQGLTVLEYGKEGGCEGLLERIRELHPDVVLERFIVRSDSSKAEQAR